MGNETSQNRNDMAEAKTLAQNISKTSLACPICIEAFQDPRTLPCHHGFCKECLVELVKSGDDKRTVVCPTCRRTVTLPKNGVQGLPVHFSSSDTHDAEIQDNKPSSDTCCSNCNSKTAVVRCLDCKDSLCDSCYASHKTLKAMKDHTIVTMADIISGKVTLKEQEDKYCQVHGKKLEYYCKTEEKAICQNCIILIKVCKTEHDHVSLDKAVMMKSADLDRLTKKCDIILNNYQEAVKTTQRVESELEVNLQQAKRSLQKVKKEFIHHLEKMVTKHEAEIDRIKKERLKELDKKKTSLESAVRRIKKAKEHTRRVTKSGSDHEVLTNHATLATQLQELSQSKPQAANKSLGYVKFEAAIPTVPSIGQLLVGTDAALKWKQSSQFSTGDFNGLHGLAIDQDGDIALTSWNKGARVYSRSGRVKCKLYDSPGALDVAATHDHKYVSIPKGERCIKFHDIQGNQLSTIPIKNVNNKPSGVNSVAIDTEGRIIVGQTTNTISIHHPDGALISKFATQSRPFRLATTSNGEIVTCIYDLELKRSTSVLLMDYSGGNVRVLQPPPDVKVWAPSFVCCKQGEIFVSNSGWGDPTGVYRYTSEGEYLGRVTTDVTSPRGIALTDDGMELFVADNGVGMKIFQQQ